MVAEAFVDMPGGLKMPAIGIGTAGSPLVSDLEDALNLALEVGYRHIDTAFMYDTEATIGKVLKQWFSSGKLKREDVFVTTKLPMFGVYQEKVETFMKKSLENLQLDYVDLYLIHFPVAVKYVEGKNPLENPQVEATDHRAVWKKMEEQVDAGRTKAIGLSNFNIRQIENILKAARIKPACLQIEIHLFLQQRELVNFCHKNNIVVVAYGPLGSPGVNTVFEKYGMEVKPLPDILNNPAVQKIAEKHKKTTAQVALRYLIQNNTVPIPKSVTPARIKENIDVFDFTLDSNDMKALGNLEVGEKARVFDFNFMSQVSRHPEWPFEVK